VIVVPHQMQMMIIMMGMTGMMVRSIAKYYIMVDGDDFMWYAGQCSLYEHQG
jgi:hypothetical protein